jgi:hypothetical protein
VHSTFPSARRDFQWLRAGRNAIARIGVKQPAQKIIEVLVNQAGSSGARLPRCFVAALTGSQADGSVSVLC